MEGNKVMNNRLVWFAIGYLAYVLFRNQAIRPGFLERPWLGGS